MHIIREPPAADTLESIALQMNEGVAFFININTARITSTEYVPRTRNCEIPEETLGNSISAEMEL